MNPGQQQKKQKNEWLAGILRMQIGHSQTFKTEQGFDVWQRVPGGWVLKTFVSQTGGEVVAVSSVYIRKSDGQLCL